MDIAGKANGIDVEKYSDSVIRNYAEQSQQVGAGEARSQVVSTMAEAAQGQHGIREDRAQKIGEQSISKFHEHVKNGMEPEKAATQASRDMAEKYDSRGREVEKAKDTLSL